MPCARTLRGVTDTAEAPDRVSPPRTIVLAFTALIANVVISVLNAALLWGFQDYLRRQLVKSNNKLKPTDKHFKKDYNLQAGFDKVNHDLHSGLTVGLVQTAIFGLLLVLLAVNFRRGKGWARWATVLVLLIVVQAPFRLLNLGGNAPIAIRLGSALVGLTGLAVIVLLFLPESSRFFAATRGVRAAGDPRAAAPMGLRNLFMPRPRPTVEPDARPVVKPDAAPAKRPSTSESSARSGEKRAKAKARAGVEAAPPPPSSKPTGAASAKNRGKSRKGS
jgi:hypothetical protein